jgi:peptidoglycan/LPS O-acetylase OafA/YrhL
VRYVQVVSGDLMTSFENRRVFGALDGLRACAILAVLWHHTQPSTGLGLLSTRGFLGVDLFFVLSGFLIATLLLRGAASSGTVALKKFYIRRTLRIFPPYYALLGLVIAATLINPASQNPVTPVGVLVAASYTGNFFPHLLPRLLELTWSLAAEEQFYLLWPAAQKWLRSNTLRVALLVLLLALSMMVQAMHAAGWVSLLFLRVAFTPILMGVLLAHLLHMPRTRIALFGSPLAHRWAAPTMFAVMMATVAVMPEPLLGGRLLLLHAIMTALLASLVINEDNTLMPVLRNRVMMHIGARSYGVYLFHLLGLHLATKLQGLSPSTPNPATFVITLVITLVIAEASYHVLEKPCLRLKQRWGA